MSNKNALVVGIGMSPRGEMAMAIALLAFVGNIIDISVFTALVLMSLLTSMVAPPLLKSLLCKEDGTARKTCCGLLSEFNNL